MTTTVYRSKVNGLKFDSIDPMTNSMLSSFQKQNLVAEESEDKATNKADKNGKVKAKLTIDDVEQEIR